VIDLSGAGNHVPKVDIKIRRLKEVYWGVKEDLPWKLPLIFVKDLVAYVVACLNVYFTMAMNQKIAPKVLFTGMCMDFKKELSLAFGYYCEVYVRTDNTSRARTAACIALHPYHNATGLWTFYNLHTHARISKISKSQWTKMVTTQLIVDAVNALDSVSPRRFWMSFAAGVRPPPRYTLVTQLNPGSHNDAIRNEGIRKAEIEEVLMCFVTLGALLPVLKSELEGAVAFSCHMFTIEKFLANGEHDKFKARLVAHGNEQDTLLYPD
jgi:hypothetical protein